MTKKRCSICGSSRNESGACSFIECRTPLFDNEWDKFGVGPLSRFMLSDEADFPHIHIDPLKLAQAVAEAAREDSGTPARCPTCNSPNIILRGVLGVINLYRIDVARRGAALCADKWHDTRAEDSGTAPTPLLDQLLDDCVQTIVTDALSGNDRRWLMNRTRDRISALISIYLERRGAVCN